MSDSANLPPTFCWSAINWDHTNPPSRCGQTERVLIMSDQAHTFTLKGVKHCMSTYGLTIDPKAEPMCLHYLENTFAQQTLCLCRGTTFHSNTVVCTYLCWRLSENGLWCYRYHNHYPRMTIALKASSGKCGQTYDDQNDWAKLVLYIIWGFLSCFSEFEKNTKKVYHILHENA
jgi:hypothetical protein